MTEREFAIEIVARLQKVGYQALWAGGCVRDEVLGLPPVDYDVATNARPEQVQALFRRSHNFGASFGVVEVLGPRDPEGKWLKVQVATFRSDGTYSDGRRPDTVTFSSAEEDAQRRDFTINGMFFDPIAGKVIDYVGGKQDLEQRILRAIGNPNERFTEDKLRILRAVRMAARFELAIDPKTLEAAQGMASQIRIVSAERVAEELRKILTNRHRTQGMMLLREFRLIPEILPELVPTFDLPQGSPLSPTGTLWQHIVKVLETLQGPLFPQPAAISFPLAFAAILHDIGKPRTIARTPERYTFHGHEHVGARMATEIGQRLRLSNAEIQRITWLVQFHQYLCDAPILRQSKLKPILIHPGIGELIALHRADAIASQRCVEHVEFCERCLRELPPEELNPPPLLTGDDLRAAGYAPGPDFKRLLEAVREAQLEGRLQSKDEALQLVQELLQQPGP